MQVVSKPNIIYPPPMASDVRLLTHLPSAISYENVTCVVVAAERRRIILTKMNAIVIIYIYIYIYILCILYCVEPVLLLM